MGRNLQGNEDYENAREKIRTVRLHIRKLTDPQQPIHIKRKLLQDVQVGKGVMAALENIALPFIKLIIRSIGRKGRKLK